MKFVFLAALFLISFCIQAQQIDVQHYRFGIEVNDENNKINGTADICLLFLQPVKNFSIDLVQQGAGGKGMKVERVTGKNVSGFQQIRDKLVIALKRTSAVNSIDSFKIVYSGVPADGLIISRNKFGDRTFFADNWPNRAHYWIPCNDTPSDKASVEFIVTSPAHYQTISNGVQIAADSSNGKRQSHWQEAIALPTKVMVIGIAKFAIGQLGTVDAVPVSAYVYPQDEQKGFYDYGVALDILKFYNDYIGPFPYKKLANVESKTIFGGMENAGAIFYAENSVTGTRHSEDLVAHEIAHQWFGDMATERSFVHVWLSEGFASYLTDLYLEHAYGKERLAGRLQQERSQVIQFSHTAKNPVVDSVSVLMERLNANSYQKGAWILHMLRQQTGDTVFQKIIQTYYQTYKGSNADTRDFERIAEEVSGKDLKPFFDQWLYRPGVPQLGINWKYEETGSINFVITQSGEEPYKFPLEVAITLEDGKQLLKKYEIKDLITIVKQKVSSKPVKVIIDPNTRLLFEQTGRQDAQ